VHLIDSVLPQGEHGLQLQSEQGQQLDTQYNKLNANNHNNFETITYSAMAGVNPSEKRITVHVEFQDELYDALLDTGASKSFINKALVSQLNLKTVPTKGTISLGDKNLAVERKGETEPLTIICNDHTVCTPFEILDLELPFVIGMDIFHNLGFSIGGISVGQDKATRLPEPIEDEHPPDMPLETPAVELTEAYQTEHNQFMAFIDHALLRNTQISRKSYCTVPEMKVFLPVPQGTTLFQ
jgi:hypothetical protein